MSDRASRVPAVEAPPLAPTLAELGGEPREGLERCAALGFRHVQLNAGQPGLRPRELDRSARRDLAGAVRRLELAASGIDLWIPADHFTNPAHVDRAVNAVSAAVEFAGDMGRCPLSLVLPDLNRAAGASDGKAEAGELRAVIGAIVEQAHRHGVELANHALPLATNPELSVGIDPAAALGQGLDPTNLVTQAGERLACARLNDLLTSGMRSPAGELRAGRLDVLAYRVALSVVGYRRPVVVDARQWMNPIQGLKQTVECWSAAGES